MFLTATQQLKCCKQSHEGEKDKRTTDRAVTLKGKAIKWRNLPEEMKEMRESRGGKQ